MLNSNILSQTTYKPNFSCYMYLMDVMEPWFGFFLFTNIFGLLGLYFDPCSNTFYTPHNFRVCARWIAPKKRFKIYYIPYILHVLKHFPRAFRQILNLSGVFTYVYCPDFHFIFPPCFPKKSCMGELVVNHFH